METSTSADVILQVVDSALSPIDRDRYVRIFEKDLIELDLVPIGRIAPLMDRSQDDARYGLQVQVAPPEDVVVWVKDISDRLVVNAVEVRLTCTIRRMRVQIQTASAEDLLAILPAIDAILPAEQVFQARAETYAYRGGEISPVEQANLDLLRYRLNLPPEIADSIIDRALGPYADKPSKLEKYRQVLNAELERQPPPLDETTQAELRRLYQSLGLSYKDIEPINQEYVTRIQAEATRLRMEQEATRLQQETHLQEEANQQQAAAQQNYAELYRDEFASTIASTLYPNEFDRGRLEQARRHWQLDGELVRAIEREVTDERYGPIDSGMGLDYSRLRQLLWLNQWQAADQETERLILSALSQDMRSLEENAILRLNCIDVQTLDSLWSRYSQNKFGFSAQHRIYIQQEGIAWEFLETVGWKTEGGLGGVNPLGRRKAYRDLQFNLKAPVGHLPTWRWGADSLEGEYVLNEDIVHNVFRELIEKCLPGLSSRSTSNPEAPEAESP